MLMLRGYVYLHGAQAVQAGNEGGADDGTRSEAQACSHKAYVSELQVLKMLRTLCSCH